MLGTAITSAPAHEIPNVRRKYMRMGRRHARDSRLRNVTTRSDIVKPRVETNSLREKFRERTNVTRVALPKSRAKPRVSAPQSRPQAFRPGVVSLSCCKSNHLNRDVDFNVACGSLLDAEIFLHPQGLGFGFGGQIHDQLF